MTDETANGAATAAPAETEAQQEPQVRLNILAQFIRDLSFENIVAQKGIAGGLPFEFSAEARRVEVTLAAQ